MLAQLVEDNLIYVLGALAAVALMGERCASEFSFLYFHENVSGFPLSIAL